MELRFRDAGFLLELMGREKGSFGEYVFLFNILFHMCCRASVTG